MIAKFFKTASVVGWVAVAASTGAAAQDYPSRSVTLVVPFAAGGGASQVAQLLRGPLEKELGQTFVIDNRPGAGTVVGSAAVARAPADGYTLLLASSANAVNESLSKALPYNTLTAFTPISLIVDAPFVLLANNKLGINTVVELIAKAKAEPRKLTYGSAGIGSAHQLFMEFLAKTASIDLRHVPYQGGNPAATAVVSGEVSIAFADAGAAQELIKGGLVKALALSSGERLASLPDVPTMEEAGVKGFNVTTWQGIVGPAGLPAPVVQRLHQAIAKVLAMPEIQQALERTGKKAMPSTPEQFAKLLQDEVARWKQVVEAAKIEVR